jgi:hypothetical protein
MEALEKDRPDQRLATRLLLFCGAIGPFLFVVVFLIEGAAFLHPRANLLVGRGTAESARCTAVADTKAASVGLDETTG